jgi:hypothetical protein
MSLKKKHFNLAYICTLFTTGRIIFVAVFLVLFTAVLIYGYYKDSAVTKLHFRKPYKILIAMLIFLAIQFFIVKIRHFF